MTVAPAPRVLLHGWGLNLRVFDTLLAALADAPGTDAGAVPDALRVDLPGHGRSALPGDLLAQGADAVAARLAQDLPPRMHLVGWSLGGLVALALAAREPQRIATLTLLASTPRFVAAADWPHGLAPAVLANFATHLQDDYERTVHEFLELQVRGSAQGSATLRELHAALAAQGAASPQALAAGLELLAGADLRARLHAIHVPTLVIGGQYDRVTPPQAGRALAAMLPQGRYSEVARAGHAPFISHAAQVAAWIGAFTAEAGHVH